VEQRRRRVPRQEADWPGRYRFECERGAGHGAVDGDGEAGDGDGEDPAKWGRCRVIDISVIGAGIEIFGAAPSAVVGRKLIVEVETPAGASVSIRMVGEVRNSSPGSQGGARVGIEFVDLSRTERSILEALERMQVVW
jgi:hypothetical protein